MKNNKLLNCIVICIFLLSVVSPSFASADQVKVSDEWYEEKIVEEAWNETVKVSDEWEEKVLVFEEWNETVEVSPEWNETIEHSEPCYGPVYYEGKIYGDNFHDGFSGLIGQIYMEDPYRVLELENILKQVNNLYYGGPLVAVINEWGSYVYASSTVYGVPSMLLPEFDSLMYIWNEAVRQLSLPVEFYIPFNFEIIDYVDGILTFKSYSADGYADGWFGMGDGHGHNWEGTYFFVAQFQLLSEWAEGGCHADYDIVGYNTLTKVINHPAVFETITHPAVWETIFHDAVYEIIEHPAIIEIIHHSAVYKNVSDENKNTSEEQIQKFPKTVNNLNLDNIDDDSFNNTKPPVKNEDADNNDTLKDSIVKANMKEAGVPIIIILLILLSSLGLIIRKK